MQQRYGTDEGTFHEAAINRENNKARNGTRKCQPSTDHLYHRGEKGKWNMWGAPQTTSNALLPARASSSMTSSRPMTWKNALGSMPFALEKSVPVFLSDAIAARMP